MQCLAHVFGSGAADIVNRLDRNLAAIGLFVILATAFAVVTATRTGVITGRSRVLDRASVREALGQGRVGHHAASGLLVLQDAVDSIENGRLWFGNQIIVGHISSVLCSEGFGDGVLQPFPA